MLNLIRTGVAPVECNLIKWGLLDRRDEKCKCGALQDMEHLHHQFYSLLCPGVTGSVLLIWPAVFPAKVFKSDTSLKDRTSGGCCFYI